MCIAQPNGLVDTSGPESATKTFGDMKSIVHLDGLIDAMKSYGVTKTSSRPILAYIQALLKRILGVCRYELQATWSGVVVLYATNFTVSQYQIHV